jgi:hypothetical protein
MMADSSHRPPIFPYRVVWEEIGDQTVTFGNLEGRRQEFQTLVGINIDLKLGVPCASSERLAGLVRSLGLNTGLSDQLIARLDLVAGWYLAPKIRGVLKQSLPQVRELLAQVAEDARRLYGSVSQVDPRTAAVLYWMLAPEPDCRDPEEPIIVDRLASRIHDLALVAGRAAADMPVNPGRPKEYVRDSALMLAIEAVEEFSGERVGLSRGTQARPEPHFSNRTGHIIRDLFAEMGLTQETLLAQAVERLRRRAPRA